MDCGSDTAVKRMSERGATERMDIIADMLRHGRVDDEVHDVAERAKYVSASLIALQMCVRAAHLCSQGGVITFARRRPRPGVVRILHPMYGRLEQQEGL